MSHGIPRGSTPSKWTRPFWGTDCRRSPKSLLKAFPRLKSLQCQRLRVLAGLVFREMLSQYPQSACQGSPRVAGGVSSSLRPKPSASICSVLRGQAHLRKITPPPWTSPEQWIFLSLAFFNAPSLRSFDSLMKNIDKN